MEHVWFVLIALMLTAYVIFDGFDLGAGAVHLLIAKNSEERRQVLRSIGPVWDGNEVWLLAAGGTLYFAFPMLYASSFSGFYLPLMIVLWLLILRGISVEFRSHIQNVVWVPFFDVVFSLSSLLLAVVYGAALGNVVRGVPLDSRGWFFVPLWTDFRVGPNPGILDIYTIAVGLAALGALSLHGSLWVAFKTEGIVQTRALRLARKVWWGVVVLTITITAATLQIQPQVMSNFTTLPWEFICPALAVGGLYGVRHFTRKERPLPSFLSSCFYLVGMMTSVVFGLHPLVLPSSTSPELALTVTSVAAPYSGLRTALFWWIPGIVLVIGYFVFTYRRFSGKVPSGENGHY